MSTNHELRAWPGYFQAMWTGQKTFEVRYDDRGFQRGDTVTIREWDPKWTCSCPRGDDAGHRDLCERYTGRELTAEIGHVLASTPRRGEQRGFFGNGYVVFSLCNPQQHDLRDQPTPADEPVPFVPTPLTVARRAVRS